MGIEAIEPLGDSVGDEQARLRLLSKEGLSEPASAAKQPQQVEHESTSKQKSQPASLTEFRALVKPLENIGDEYGPKRLNGWGRNLCFAAFAECPEGFEVCIARVYGKWQKGESEFPLGLLCRMVEQEEHDIDADANEGGPDSSSFGDRPCSVCGRLIKDVNGVLCAAGVFCYDHAPPEGIKGLVEVGYEDDEGREAS